MKWKIVKKNKRGSKEFAKTQEKTVVKNSIYPRERTMVHLKNWDVSPDIKGRL